MKLRTWSGSTIDLPREWRRVPLGALGWIRHAARRFWCVLDGHLVDHHVTAFFGANGAVAHVEMTTNPRCARCGKLHKPLTRGV